MADFQKQLEEYRLRKRRTERFENWKIKFQKFLMLGTGKNSPTTRDTTIDVKTDSDTDAAVAKEDDPLRFGSKPQSLTNEQQPHKQQQSPLSSDFEEDIESDNKDERNESKLLKYTLWTVYFLFWVTLYVIAIELQFGLVFLMFSALAGIYLNTRTGPRKRNEISAYSVFNKNCESIDGTLKAEQFEREMRYGAGSVR